MGNLFEDYTRKCRPYHFHTLSTYCMDMCECLCITKRKSINCYYLNFDLFLAQKPVKSEGTEGRRSIVLFNPFHLKRATKCSGLILGHWVPPDVLRPEQMGLLPAHPLPSCRVGVNQKHCDGEGSDKARGKQGALGITDCGKDTIK